MRIDKIYFENFKSLSNNEFQLGNLTLLTGINSSGKSTLIQGILFIKQNIVNLSEFQEFKNLEINPLSVLKKMKLNGKYIELGIGRNILYENSKKDNIKISIVSKESCIDFKIDTVGNTENDVLPCDVEYEKDNINLFLNNGLFQYLRAERVGTRVYYEYSKADIDNDSLGISGEYTAHYLAQNRSQDIYIKELKHPNSVTHQLLENVTNWLSNISKGIDIKSEIIQDLRKVKLSYNYEGGKKDYLPQDVGFGITYVLPIIVSILKSKPGDLIIIENPESHLHPSGQVEIARLCSMAASFGVQIIIETHSDHFLNGVRVATKERKIQNSDIQIYYFNKDIDEAKSIITKIEINSEGKLLNWPKGFFDEWDIQLEKLLW